MSDKPHDGRQPGWRILIAATAVTLTGGAAAVNAASGDSAGRVTLDDVLPMREISAAAPIVTSAAALQVIEPDRDASPFDVALRRLVASQTDTTADVTADATPTPNDLTPDPTPNDLTPDPTPNTPNSPDPTPNSPDPTPNTPNSPDPTPNSPDPTPNSPDPTPNTPNSPDASPDGSPD